MNRHNEFCIRRASSSDIAILTDFNCRLAVETEGRTLDAGTVMSGVTRGLGRGDEVRYFIAEIGDSVTGQLMLTREWSDWRDGWIYWLQSVYIASDFRGQGVFRQLLDHVTQLLSSEPDVVCLRLYVEEENQAAIATYTRLGFQRPGYHVMERPLR